MSGQKMKLGMVVSLVALMVVGAAARAQERDQDERRLENQSTPPPERGMFPADGHQRRGVPMETYAVAPGTQFLVRLEDGVSSKEMRENQRFKVRTLEPLLAGSGIYLPAGAEINGHVSRVEPAGVAGRAKIWLTFDEIRTKFGRLPIVADVVDVPGDHSIKTGEIKEGTLQGRTTREKDALPAAAAGAATGAVRGVKDKNKKEAMEGAAMGALTAFLMESGRGHDINLPKGAKLELELGRALYLVKE
ncbi:MAG TPA: hypothetical protein VN982_16700 [Candidatus Dormibacteraeota bacterium]|nr:hypothetical protein [Candidatus Dormibacteraeota bacterium]